MLVLAALAGPVWAGCQRGGEATGPSTVLPPRPLPPLTSFTPAGSTWVLALAPHELLSEPVWAGIMDVAFPVAQRQAFERLFVIRPLEVREAALVRWGDAGFVALMRGDFPGDQVVQGLGMRMNTVEVSAEDPVRRVGFLGTVRREALQLGGDAFAYSGDAGPAMVEIAANSAGGTPDTSASQASVERARVEALLGPAPVRYLHLVPIAPPPESPLYLVLARQRALGVALRATGPDTLELHVVLTGEFPATIEDNARAVLDQLFRSDLGRTLLGREPPSLVLVVGEQSVQARVQLRAGTLHAGLRTLFVDGLAELLGGTTL